MKTTLLFLFVIFSISLFAQTTSIPDEGFEQALIDLGIDSDQSINGQVLTSDVASVTSLDLSWNMIDKITGIESFISLEVLNISNAHLYYYNTALDLSSLTNLRELYFDGYGDVITNSATKVILSNNPNLEFISAIGNWPLEILDLKESDLNISNLELWLGDYDGWTGEPIPVCVEVTNPTEATNDQGIYSSWNMYGPMNFSSDCNLGTLNKQQITAELYPNPVREQFQIQTSKEIKEVNLYSLNGKEVAKFNVQRAYDISQLPAGIYFVQILTSKGTATQKLIKN
ncbi:T9SS type A sorting domain-containing protein [Mesonia ostreae]|uniref:T9SS type A sorting domain-containing protein n=1 Tax=Mesonia ostreae TaxID=861110 RepID=A0ABU2KLJ9_9FLAO|nr:T9SS type A sorting domain-containing protein [Mesonia ostreae]MDT0295593.1 T9SS type A sorting domain-containing protein [Mesonia ostreae]